MNPQAVTSIMWFQQRSRSKVSSQGKQIISPNMLSLHFIYSFLTNYTPINLGITFGILPFCKTGNSTVTMGLEFECTGGA